MKSLIVIPAFNEAKSLPSVIKEIRNSLKNIDILVIDDGSLDQTSLVAQKSGALVIQMPYNLGIASSRETGLWYALENDYDILIQMDADGQHDSRYIPKLLEPILLKRADAVIGSRFVNNKNIDQTSTPRYFGISLLSLILAILTGQRIFDPTSGFSAYNKRAMGVLAKNYPSDYPEPEIPIILHRAALKLKEVSVKMRIRKTGQSSISYKNALYFLGKVLIGMIVTMLRKVER